MNWFTDPRTGQLQNAVNDALSAARQSKRDAQDQVDAAQKSAGLAAQKADGLSDTIDMFIAENKNFVSKWPA